MACAWLLVAVATVAAGQPASSQGVIALTRLKRLEIALPNHDLATSPDVFDAAVRDGYHVVVSLGDYLLAISGTGASQKIARLMPFASGLIVRIGLKTDTLWILDALHGRIGLLTDEGAPLRVIDYDEALWGPFYAYRLTVAPAALLANGGVLGEPLVPADLIATGQVSGVPLLRTTEQGTIIDTLAQLKVHHRLLRIELANGDEIHYIAEPFSDQSFYGVDPNGEFIVVVDQSRFAPKLSLAKIDMEGDTVFNQTYPTRRIPVDEDRFRRSVHDLAATVDSRVTTPMIVQAIRESAFRPEIVPCVRGIYIGIDGSIWVRLLSEPPNVEWRVYGPGGDSVGYVALRKNHQLVKASMDELWVAYSRGQAIVIDRYRVESM